MALINTFEKSGNFLFKYRGQMPFLLFVIVIPVIFYTDYSTLSANTELILKLISILVCLLGFAVRIYTIGTASPNTSGRNTDKQVAESLNTTGIYSMVRHPLYLGNYLMWAGITMYVLNPWFLIIVSLLFWIYYERIMFAEERFLEKKFGNDFFQWASKVPAFLPAFKKFFVSQNSFSIRNVLIKEYSGFLAAVISFVFIEVLQDSFIERSFSINELSIFIITATLILVLFLRIISKKLRDGKMNWIS